MPMKVRMEFKRLSDFGGAEQELEHITEIHFNFKNAVRENRIAFESDIDSTGCVYDLSDIYEFEAVDDILDKKDRLLNARNEIIDVADDIDDFLYEDMAEGYGFSFGIKESVMKRLKNALALLNEVYGELGIDEDYVPDE